MPSRKRDEKTGILDVTDEPAERDSLPTPPVETGQPPDPAGSTAERADRRAFIRQLSGDAVASAGRIAGLSSAIRRSVVAAGLAATRELEAAPGPGLPDHVPAQTDATDLPSPRPGEVEMPQPTARVLDVVAALTPAEHAFLAGGDSAVLAVNDPAGAPHMSASIYHWDGAILRLPSLMFAARAEQVERDPRVSVFIEDRAAGAWVAVAGVASIVYGPGVEDELRLVLAESRLGETAAGRWAALRASTDAIVIRVRPTRFLWRKT